MIAADLIWPVLESEGLYKELSLKALLFSGADCERFLGGQLTQDISLVKTNAAQFSARLNNKGQVKSWQILLKGSRGYIALVEEGLVQSFKEDLEKYIIMDDVEIELSPDRYACFFGLSEKTRVEGAWLSALAAPIQIVKREDIPVGTPEISSELFAKLALLGAWPSYSKTIKPDALVNETIFELNGVSYAKGCFLGQETAAKIHSRRGASYAPALLTGKRELAPGNFESLERKAGEVLGSFNHQGQWIHLCQLFREFRVEGLELEITGHSYIVSTQSAPFSLSLREWAQKLYDHATELFKGEKEQESLRLLKLALELDPTFADAYEVLGVILGRHERYQEAIEYMDKLSECDPHSVMAHTNKSLYLMKLGKITEAEEEKSKATVKTFERLGREAAAKREAEARVESEKLERERRRGMFNQVLEIDPEDEIALFGLGDIAFHDKDYAQALNYFERVLKSNPKHSRAFLMSGRAHEELGSHTKAIEAYKQGMEVATKAGELMPAAEMRSRMVALSSP